MNYANPYIRGLSRVAARPRPAFPPRGYKEPSDTEGILVLTEPLREVHIPWTHAREMLPSGEGPLTSAREARNGYFFPLNHQAALDLLQAAGLIFLTENPSEEWEPPSRDDVARVTDRWSTSVDRVEQRFLRRQQIEYRGSSCSLCGSELPEELLIAAHIKPRSVCSEKERMDIRNVAMLACLFGCDALFELGYLIVNGAGIIEAGRPAPTAVKERAEDIIQRRCRAHDQASGQYFAWHREHHQRQPNPTL